MTHYAACYPHQALLRMPEQICRFCRVKYENAFTPAQLLGCACSAARVTRFEDRISRMSPIPVSNTLFWVFVAHAYAHTQKRTTHTRSTCTTNAHTHQHSMQYTHQHSVAGYKKSKLSPQRRHGITSAHGKQRYMHGMCYYC